MREQLMNVLKDVSLSGSTEFGSMFIFFVQVVRVS